MGGSQRQTAPCADFSWALLTRAFSVILPGAPWPFLIFVAPAKAAMEESTTEREEWYSSAVVMLYPVVEIT
jgi:hypothetical protein